MFHLRLLSWVAPPERALLQNPSSQFTICGTGFSELQKGRMIHSLQVVNGVKTRKQIFCNQHVSFPQSFHILFLRLRSLKTQVFKVVSPKYTRNSGSQGQVRHYQHYFLCLIKGSTFLALFCPFL